MKKSKPKPAETKRPRGRPSEYKPEVAAEICARIALGESLNKITHEEHMPDMSTVYRWMFANEEFRVNYTRAREDQCETYADQLVSIADELPPMDQSGKTDSGYVAWQKTRIDTRKWIASKLKPKKFGDKVGVEHSGGMNLIVATGIPDDTTNNG